MYLFRIIGIISKQNMDEQLLYVIRIARGSTEFNSACRVTSDETRWKITVQIYNHAKSGSRPKPTVIF